MVRHAHVQIVLIAVVIVRETRTETITFQITNEMAMRQHQSIVSCQTMHLSITIQVNTGRTLDNRSICLPLYSNEMLPKIAADMQMLGWQGPGTR